MYDLIEVKKNKGVLTKEDISYIVKDYLGGNIPDYQVSALLMAIYFNGLNLDETFNLTEEIINSGQIVDLSGIKGMKVDKHSTGGVGDTTTLVLGPLVAACDVVFAKMSGRGLGHTGGTLDKLESIPGFSIDMSIEEFIKSSNTVKLTIIGQSADITPADKALYALRDTTATVDNISLIASSILSKKIALGTDALILDVKVGSGAFMKKLDDAIDLANLMVKLGGMFNRKTSVLLSSMEEPLGMAVGNSLEVIEAIETLKGNGPEDLVNLCLALGTKLLIMAKDISPEKAREELTHALNSGAGFEKFKEFVSNQGGDTDYIDDLTKLPLSSKRVEITALKSGYVKSLDALLVGESARILGAGRATKEDILDLGAGVLLNKKIDSQVSKGELIATIYTDKEDALLQEAVDKIQEAYVIGDKNKNKKVLILQEIE